MTNPDLRPPRENLVRSMFPGVEYRDVAEDGSIGTLFGHLAVWDQWTEIDSRFEGQFMERVSAGAFTKYLHEQPMPKVLLNHGQDPQVGDKPLGAPSRLEADKVGMYYEVPLLDTSYNRDIAPAARAGLYGSSFRFSVVKDDFQRSSSKSSYNPKGLPERTIQEATLPEFGPVTFPAYVGATSGVRSETDDYLRHLLVPERSLSELAGFLLADKAALQGAIDKLSNGEPLLAQEAELLEAAIEHLEPPDDDEDDMQMASASPSDDEHSRVSEPVPATPPDGSRKADRFRTRQEYLQWLMSHSSAS